MQVGGFGFPDFSFAKKNETEPFLHRAYLAYLAPNSTLPRTACPLLLNSKALLHLECTASIFLLRKCPMRLDPACNSALAF